MDDLIRRQELENLLVVAQDEDFITLEEYDKFWDLVSIVPNAKPKGEWKIKKSTIHPYGNDVCCSICGHTMGSTFGYKFCPMCGADMKGEDNETD